MTVELMLAAALALVVTLGMAAMGVTLTRFFREGGDRLKLQQDAARTGRWITLAVRRASSWTIYDPLAPNTPLAEGPAVRLLDAHNVVIEEFRRDAATGKQVVDRAGRAVSGFTVSDLWFATGPDGALAVRVALYDRYGNRNQFDSAALPRN
jgi:hypothetical protein